MSNPSAYALDGTDGVASSFIAKLGLRSTLGPCEKAQERESVAWPDIGSGLQTGKPKCLAVGTSVDLAILG